VPRAGATAQLPSSQIPSSCDGALTSVSGCAAFQKCKHSYRLFDSLVEAQVKAQLREQVRSSMLERGAPRSHSHPRVELLATIVSWAIYGAALEWSQRPGGQSAEAFAAEALPLIAASISALDSGGR
jgi:hypothetical protein